MATGNAVVTGKTGPAIAMTAQPIANLTGFNYDFTNQILTLHQGTTETIIDVSANTTTTLVFAAGNYVLTVS